MNVRKYFAADMRSALEMVRVQQGPDVLILSNRKVENGVELITADEPLDDSVINSLREEQLKSATLGKKRQQKNVRPTVKRVVSAATNTIQSKRNRANDTPAEQENILWTDENTVKKMQLEMRTIKGLLEQQLSGLAWSDYGTKYPSRARLLRTLSRLGFAATLAKDLVDQVPGHMKIEDAWKFTLRLVCQRLAVLHDPILSVGGRAAICGSTGVGKSALVCKLAATYGMRHGVDKVSIVSMDENRLGAHQQLKVFSRLTGIAFHAISGGDDLTNILNRQEKSSLVLIDTPGYAPDDIRFRELFARLCGVDVYLALAATTDYPSHAKMLTICAETNVTGCVVTKIDEAVLVGGVLSALISAKLPLAYTSAGQSVPDDLDLADAKQLIAQAVAMGATSGLKADNTSIEHAFA